jgi:hypothetical protein
MNEKVTVTQNSIQMSECRLRLVRPVETHEAPYMRVFFGRKFEDEVLMHNHDSEGRLIYEYPRVQLKVLDRTAVLIGINEGSQLLQRLWLDIDPTTLGSKDLEVLETQFETRQEQISVTAEPLEYRFSTPWLALNPKNFQSYVGSRNQRFRKDELSRILVGNCLGLAKSLGIRFADHIAADCRGLTSIKTLVNGNGMIGFVGKFSVNLTIPEHLGLGKSVSRGFGTVASC